MLNSAKLPFIFIKASALGRQSTELGRSFWKKYSGVKIAFASYDESCCEKCVNAVKTENKRDCEPVCTESVRTQTNDTFNLGICLGIGCSSSRWCGLHKGYDKFDCSGCRKWLRTICSINSSKPCKQITKGRSYHYSSDQGNSESKSSRGSHSIKSTDDKQLIDAKNTPESPFFSLSSAIRTGKPMTVEQQDTDLEINSDMIVEIVQSTTGAALVIGLIVLLDRIRNRYNRIVHRTIPKSKFPPPHQPNGNQA